MSAAVASRPRARVNPVPPPAVPTLDTVRASLEQVRASILLAIEGAAEGSAAATLLQHADETMLATAIAALAPRSLTTADLDAVYLDLFLPLATLEGALALSAGSVVETSIKEAHKLLDWAQTQMDSAGEIAASLPAPLKPSQRQPQPDDSIDDEQRRRKLASEANQEIEKLAEAAIHLLERNRDEDFLMYHGILRRIQALSLMNFFSLRLHGDDGEDAEREWGELSRIATLERAYGGWL